MGFHTFPIDRAAALDDPVRYRFCSREELIALLDPTSQDRVLDIGSGTGFYSAEVAPFVGSLYAIDVQQAMHRHHRKHEPGANIHLLTGDISALPIADNVIDRAFAVDTHHEYYSPAAMAELARTIRPGGRLVTIDWSADGDRIAGPPLAERFSPAEITEHLAGAGFTILERQERPETVAIVAQR